MSMELKIIALSYKFETKKLYNFITPKIDSFCCCTIKTRFLSVSKLGWGRIIKNIHNFQRQWWESIELPPVISDHCRAPVQILASTAGSRHSSRGLWKRTRQPMIFPRNYPRRTRWQLYHSLFPSRCMPISWRSYRQTRKPRHLGIKTKW